uniref:Putative peptide/nitrate transporter n=1 Tax=Talaromyces marneffei PM1 TaxID=1077442 RepID=A0A093VN20_TALMA
MAQIMLLCFARIAEPIAFFSIFPFMSQMIEDAAGVAESEVGFYSGLIESIFSFTQMLLMIPWGRAADKFGRKPVLVVSMAGIFSGTIVAVRASISENSTPKTQARAFGYFAFSNNLGILLGPLIGGPLSRPADQYPSVFGGVQFLKDYPYALPTLTTGAIGATSCIVSILFVKEPTQGDVNGSSPKAMTTTEIMKASGVSRVLFVYTFTMLLALSYTARGYGFSELQISIFIGVRGLAQAIWLLFIFPRLQQRTGTGGILRLCASVWPFWFAATPVGNYLLRLKLDTAFWAFAPLLLVVGSSVAMAFTACQLAINDVSPSPETLGTVNAISLTLNSALRSVAPALFASLFATGVKKQIFYGYLAWIILVVLAIGYRRSLRWLPARAEGKINNSPTTAEGFDDSEE